MDSRYQIIMILTLCLRVKDLVPVHYSFVGTCFLDVCSVAGVHREKTGQHRSAQSVLRRIC